MPVPRIAIIGRPNVGKSSLLNLIAQSRVAIVDPTPGVTRDRLSVLVDLEPPAELGPGHPIRTAEFTDTGGYGVYTAEGKRFDEVGADLSTLTGDIERQIAGAVSGADLILFAVDVQAGLGAPDLEIARMLREQKLGRRDRQGRTLVPVRVVATKVDGDSWEPHAYELSGLGFGEPLMCSAKTKFMRRRLLDELWRIVPEATPLEGELEPGLKIAIVGKRNSGKSTLVNRLAGEERVIVSEIAGTTRDAIDVRIDLPDGRRITAIDTAGLRRKKSFQDSVEWYAFDRAQRAIERADVVVLMVDADREASQVDEHLAQLIAAGFKPSILAVNKWDLTEGRVSVKNRPVTPEDYEVYLREELKGLAHAPIAMLSAETGQGVSDLIDLAFELYEQASARVGTGELNRTVAKLTETIHPTSKVGRHGRVFYASQVATNPPTIVLVVNRTDLYTDQYTRYLLNRMREVLPFADVPIKLIYRSKRRVEEAAVRAGKITRGAQAEGKLLRIDPQTGQFAEEIDLAAHGLDDQTLLADMPDEPEAYFED